MPDNIAKSISYESRFSAAGLPFCALTMFVEVVVEDWRTKPGGLVTPEIWGVRV
jgi:hypothetical protein